MTVKSKLLLSLLVFSLLGISRPGEDSRLLASLDLSVLQAKKSEAGLENWIHAINSKEIDKIQRHYGPRSVKILSADQLYFSSEKIASFYQNSDIKLKTAESVFSVLANEKLQIHYDIIKLKNTKNHNHYQLLIWRKDSANLIHEFEYQEAADKQISKDYLEQLKERREQWMQLCNLHMVDSLVRELYSKNTIYYNHKQPVIGEENLIETYSYMSREEYELSLSPIKILPVNADCVFEIGQCNGSYNGKYILVWKKDYTGSWKIFIDSNI